MPTCHCRFAAVLVAGLFTLAACAATDPADADRPVAAAARGLSIVALDYDVGDLSDPAVLAKYTRADVLIVNAGQFWDGRHDLAPLRAAKPSLKIVGYFRTKGMPENWAKEPPAVSEYHHQLYLAAAPYRCWTTTGDTLRDWPGTFVFDITDPAARAAVLDVFVHYQETSANRFDGVFWDYFAPRLWIAPGVTGMDGEPDMDGDGIPQQDDPDELAAFVAGEKAWVDEMRAALGDGFIQIGNGPLACRDSTFAAKLDGMFYERFPDAVFATPGRFRNALDPAVPNNLYAARRWPRRANGGPWLILSNMYAIGGYIDASGQYQVLDADDFTRIVALLTDCSAITYQGFGVRDAGIPALEYDLGAPLGGVRGDGDYLVRDFERGRVELFMGSGDFPQPFEYRVTQEGQVIDDLDLPSIVRTEP